MAGWLVRWLCMFAFKTLQAVDASLHFGQLLPTVLSNIYNVQRSTRRLMVRASMA